MNDRIARIAGPAALLCGIATILAMVTTILFFGLEAPTIGTIAERPLVWGPLSDLCPMIQMALLLVVAYALFLIQRPGAPTLTWLATLIGVAGMLGVIALQSLLMLDVIPFEQEVEPVIFATGLVGVWIVLVNYSGRRQASLPARLTWLGIAVGVAFMLEPVLLSALGGGVNWMSAIVSNYFLMAAAALVFLVAYIGFPIWVIWLGRTFTASQPNTTGVSIPREAV